MKIDDQGENEMSTRDLLARVIAFVKFLLSRWVIIVIAGIIGGLAGLAYAYSQKPNYIANLSFVLEDGQSAGGLGAYAGLASMVGIDLGGKNDALFAGDNLIYFMKSHPMIESTLLSPTTFRGRKMSLADAFLEVTEIRKKWNEKGKFTDLHYIPGENREGYDRQKDSILSAITNAIKETNVDVFKKDKKLGIITVSVKTTNEEFSKNFAETLVEVVSDFYKKTKTKREADNVSILEHQVDSVRKVLSRAITGVAALSDINPNPNPSRQILRAPQQNKQVSVQANSAILQELVKNLEIARVTLRKETPLVMEVDKPRFPLEKEKFGRLKGLVIGGLLAGSLIIVILLAIRLWKSLNLSW